MLYFEDIPLKNAIHSESYHICKAAIIAFGKEYDPQPFHINKQAAKQPSSQAAKQPSSQAAKQWPTGLMASNIQTYALSMKLYCIN